MKKIITILIIIYFFSTGTVNAITSNGFKKILEMMNVPETNVNGYGVNEEVYNRYNLIVYGEPQNVLKNQRWKDVDNGRWINESTGKKGEYRVLGYSLTGTIVNNELFPDDYSSGKSPEEWDYIVIEDALSSWNDTEKYQTQMQYEYMLTQKLSRNGITYNITAKDIGLEKARLEAYSTWKTAGSIYTQKYDNNGVKWGATFKVPPMAADAKLDAKLYFPNGRNYVMNEKNDVLEITFSYGAEVSDLSQYARIEDIKKLTSEIEVQNELFDKLSGVKTSYINKEGKIVIDKSKYTNVDNIEIIVKNTSVLETVFSDEAPMIDIEEIVLNVNLKEESVYVTVKDINKIEFEEIPRPNISSIKVYRKSKLGESEKNALYISKNTGIPFICAGQILIVEAKISNDPSSVKFYIEGDSQIQKLDDITRKFVFDEPKARGEKLMYPSILALKKAYQLPLNMYEKQGVFYVEYIIPYGTKQTLHSWNSLRNINNNAFSIDKTKLFSRISEPYKLKIRASNDGGTVTKSINLDVFERWDTLYNRDISEYVK